MFPSFVFAALLALPCAFSVGRVLETRIQNQCCPRDSFNDAGVLINTFPFFTCAYPDGACDWDSTTGQLENSAQQNCPGFVSCENTCECPPDKTGAAGRLITMQSQGIQCAYPHGACTFSEDGGLFNATGQTNCPLTNDCVGGA
ncbi:hypothetical protein BXZ70DRAFT_907480 [Cristinia sonorae]|uniref:Uncharacterized protein n=1 Tax=Cristinia sonorae TaxID=1940300 RepID=A0A8K0XPV6_9AGAR|nr:hypothetical protein BXZ70DRAFT_907480 [Cristinia sonorae]